MDNNYSETIEKARKYFINIIKERDKYVEQLKAQDLQKRIEIETMSDSTVSERKKCFETLEKTKMRLEKELSSDSNSKKYKNKSEKCLEQVSTPDLDVETISYSTVPSTVISDLTKLSKSSSLSTAQVSKKYCEALEKAKKYFENKRDIVKKDNKQVDCSSKNAPLTSTVDKKFLDVVENAAAYSKSKEEKENKQQKDTQTNENQTPEKNKSNPKLHDATGKSKTEDSKVSASPTNAQASEQIDQKKYEKLIPGKKFLKSKLSIDKKSIIVKKDIKKNKRQSAINDLPKEPKIQTIPNSTIRDTKKAVDSKEQQPLPVPHVDKCERLTPAKRYLRSLLNRNENNINEKNTNDKNEEKKCTKSSTAQDCLKNVENETSPDARQKNRPTISPTNNAKLGQHSPKKKEIIQKNVPISTNVKKEETQKKIDQFKPLTTKTNIITNIRPSSQQMKTNSLSVEVQNSASLTKSVEKILSQALKIGLKKINNSALQDLQIKIKNSIQSSDNNTSRGRVSSELNSTNSPLDDQISNFQIEMEKRQKFTFDRIQELQNTLQLRRQEICNMATGKSNSLKKSSKNLKNKTEK